MGLSGEITAQGSAVRSTDARRRALKAFQRGPQQVVRSASPELARQEAWRTWSSTTA
jgi:hypothetical protein